MTAAIVDLRRRISNMAPSDLLTRFVVLVISTAVLIYVLMPVFWMLKSSFQTTAEIRAMPPVWLPSAPSFDPYVTANKLIPVWRYLANSLFVSVTAAVISTAIAASAAYVLARFRFPGATLILVLILLTNLIPQITRVFPIYFFIQDLKLINTYAGLILAYVSFSVPFAVLLLRGYFETSAPPELEEAAMIDGCSHFSAFWRVIIPVSLPGIAAVAIFTFLNAWNDFLWASLLLSDGALKTIQVGIGDFASEGGGVQYMNAFMAACVVTTIPALILFVLMQRWLVGGLTAGSVKS
ncbi:carbohydrate ABC transporter permease [Devosia sp. J2-20]|jgi:multiple sugar transport system permease protein|uniref:Maltose/maltodextrin transport system permease protein MalG n=1 Tax=Devosia litorisediminis TaxID=2829817 RepID=A0A942E424_9HYPH|nr:MULTISPECIES: carbohydrate ABC transporter permease [Devosia]MBS3847580.1 carbohydrate ABC transporter permease [Devosia litorisediminis]MCZ4347058.1 carbohydrate ABC transporter permease [Devosia neptuniae]WDQ99298.1 carbohydrate ABC transporter permease [Devosia sp. J2-20]|tara:strand:- start:6258 stop:7142 length:885 start_codon:yes stop_codon:yes gene_type:complete